MSYADLDYGAHAVPSGRAIESAARAMMASFVQYVVGGAVGAVADRVFPPPAQDQPTAALAAEVIGQMSATSGMVVLTSPVLVDIVDPENLLGGFAALAGLMHSQPTLLSKSRVLWNRFGESLHDLVWNHQLNVPAAAVSGAAGLAVMFGSARLFVSSEGKGAIPGMLVGAVLGTTAATASYAIAKDKIPAKL